MTDCFNCGLPDSKLRARVAMKAANAYQRSSRQTLAFCDEECAHQTMFLQLPTRSTKDSITRLLGANPIAYADYRRLVAVERVDESAGNRVSTVAERMRKLRGKKQQVKAAIWGGQTPISAPLDSWA